MRKLIAILVSSLAGIMAMPAIAAPQGAPPAAQETATRDKSKEARHAHRERRLQRAVEHGVLTQAEADTLRQRWTAQEERRKRFIASLTPEQKRLWDEMHREGRAIEDERAAHWKRLTPEQKRKLKPSAQGASD